MIPREAPSVGENRSEAGQGTLSGVRGGRRWAKKLTDPTIALNWGAVRDLVVLWLRSFGQSGASGKASSEFRSGRLNFLCAIVLLLLSRLRG